MEVRRFWTNSGGNRDALIWEFPVTEVRGGIHNVKIISDPDAANGGVRTMLIFDRAEFDEIVKAYQEHTPIVFDSGVTVAGPSLLLRLLHKVRRSAK
jgi:hypothetical protein